MFKAKSRRPGQVSLVTGVSTTSDRNGMRAVRLKYMRGLERRRVEAYAA